MSLSIWKNRDFVWLVSGRTISQVGTAITTFVIPWLLLQLTGSATQTGIAFAIGFLPYILISLPAGVWADRLNRKLLMVLSDIGRLLLLASIPLVHFASGSLPLCLLYATQAGISALSAIFDAAYDSCIPNLVHPRHLHEANNAMQTAVSLSRVVGPILGGVAMSAMGSVNALILDVISYTLSVVASLAIASPFSTSPARTRMGSVWEDAREGIQVVFAIPALRNMMVFTAFVNFVGPGMDVALLYRMQHELHLTSRWAGIAMTGLPAGMLLGAVVNRLFGKRLDIGSWLILSTCLQVLPPILLAYTSNPMAISLIQMGIGILLVAWNVQIVTLRQTLIPDHLRGRALSVFRLSAWISIPIGDAMAGSLSQRFGSAPYFLFAAAILSTVAVLSIITRLHRTVVSNTADRAC